MSALVAGDAWESGIPRPAVYAAALRAFIWADPWSHSPSEVMRGLVEPPLVSSEVGSMPVAMAGVLPLLRGDMERLRFAVLTAHIFDLFEVAAVAVDLAVSARDEALVLEAASLCGNLAVDASVRGQMLEWVGAGSMTRIRINPAAVPRSEDEEYLRHQCWPGTRGQDRKFPTAPSVVIGCGLDPAASLRLAIRVVDAGACIHRLATDSEIPLWFGPETVLICQPETSRRVLDKYPDFPERQIISGPLPDDDRGLGDLVRRLDTALPATAKLRLHEGA